MNDDELMRVVAEFRAGILNGKSSAKMCFAVCLPLHGYLCSINVETSLIEGIVESGEKEETDHYWLELPDGRIIDPTADQFPLGLPPVFLGPIPSQYDSCPLPRWD